MSKAHYDAVVDPKIDGSLNLHTLLPSAMDFFVMFSSLASIAPSFGQANYATGNTYLDSLARYRTSIDEKAVSLAFAMVIDAGFVAEHHGLAGQLSARGSTPVYMQDILALLDYYCDDRLPVLHPDESQVIMGLQTSASLRAKGVEEPYWLQRPLFSYLRCAQVAPVGGTKGTISRTNMVALERLLQQVTCLEQATALVLDALVKKLAGILVMEEADVDTSKPIHAHGVDSLVAMELRQWCRNVLRADVPIFEILGDLDVSGLAGKVAKRSGFVNAIEEKV